MIHFHRDPNWQIIGANAYYRCKCGAQRVRMAYANIAGPVEPGWPDLIDKHGRSLHDTGWMKKLT